MKRIERTIKNSLKMANLIKNKMRIYALSIDAEVDILKNNAQKYGIYHTRETNNPVERAFNNALTQVSLSSPRVEENILRLTVLVMLAANMSIRYFVMDSTTVALPFYDEIDDDALHFIEDFDTLFYKEFGYHISVKKIDSVPSILTERIYNARQYYIEEHGDWTENFLKNLGDELSRDSFVTFLQQRIITHIFTGAKICYPVEPPKQSQNWRKQREQISHILPNLVGCCSELQYEILCKHIFIYEQYGIPGVVEASSGDNIIDAGAYIGDSACYFSKKIGSGGRVFSFEVVPSTIIIAEQNMRNNGCENVEIVPKALSDARTILSVVHNPHSNAAAFISDNLEHGTNGNIFVEAITLDDFVASRNTHINFIKADIEGAEIQMLRGAAKTISQTAPTCAICLYHKQEDYWQIPQYLEGLCPDYRFWFRCEAEPVLFARRG